MMQLPDDGLSATYLPRTDRSIVYLLNEEQTGWNKIYRTDTTLWTGCRDRDGREIYDGDILETPDGLSLVYWSRRLTAFLVTLENMALPALGLLVAGTIRVVGSAFRNPELLELIRWPADDQELDEYRQPGTGTPDRPDADRTPP